MKKNFKGFVVSWLMALLIFQPLAVSADVSQNSIDYLKAASQTPWTTMALAAAQGSGITTDHLRSSNHSSLDYAKTILAVTALGENPHSFGNVDYVEQLKSFYQDSQIGSPDMLMDDAFGILALAAGGLNQTAVEILGAKNYLLSKQNTDGGWGYNIGLSSDTNSTAIIIVSLIESGINANNPVITNGLTYLAAAQSIDGGWGWVSGSESDTDSTSWVVWAIRKVGQNPTSFQKENNNPIIFIESMKNADGSFGRMFNNRDGNLMSTQNAVIALAGQTLPLGYFQQNNQNQNNQYHLRIEGPNSTICDKNLTGTTAYDLLVAGQTVCNYTFSGNRDWGTFFLDSINEIENNFPAYWMYLVNNSMVNDGLEQYVLQTGDEVLIYYDLDTNSPAYPDFDRPLRIAVDDSSPDPGQNITFTVQYYNQSWQPLAGATIFGGDQNYQTNNSGQATFALPAGYYTLYAEKQNFIRSQQIVIEVGNGVSQNVSLRVEIDQGGRGRIAGESIIFEVTPNSLDFGRLQPGRTASSTVSFNNAGTVDLRVTAAVSGDSVFSQNLKIAGSPWSTYSSDLAHGTNKQEGVSLPIPSNYIGSGIKTGELIFWAQVQ